MKVKVKLGNESEREAGKWKWNHVVFRCVGVLLACGVLLCGVDVQRTWQCE